MALLVLDTSTILKWFKEEKHTEKALKIKKEYVEGIHEIAVPDLILYEMTNAMRYSEVFDPKLIEDSLDSFLNLEINIIVPTTGVINRAVELAYEQKITVYDAVFASLAESIDATLITADKKLYKKIEKLEFVNFIEEY